MRIKTELAERPERFTVSREGNRAAIIFYTNIEEKQRDGGEDGETVTYYEAVSWTMFIPWTDNVAARIEENFSEWLQEAQTEAYDEEAAAVRKIRDSLLSASDATMALDRLGLTVPSGSTFTSWLSFLRGIGEVLGGSVATYRQALRDIPEQEGFPFDITWPEKP